MTAIGVIVKGVLDYSLAKLGIDLDLTPLDDTWTGLKQIIGSRFDDTILANVMSYRTVVSSGEGNDILGSLGYMTVFDGGAGNNTVSYEWSDYGVDANLTTGMGGNGDTYIGINNLIGGKGNNTLVGSAGANQLFGGDVGDWLDGAGGADFMAGGGGSDIYLIDDTGDVVFEKAGEGDFDQVTATINYTLTANVENLVLSGSAKRGIGNELNNSIWGNASANTLSGLDGNDRLRGNGGNDVLLGGDGNDLLVGGKGADKLIGGMGRDTFEFESVGESTVAAPDHIADFAQDCIYLRDIDARVKASGNNAFSWIGTADFSGTEGELRYEVVGNNTLVTGDLNGDGVADMAIVLDNYIGGLRANDFVL